MEQTAHNPLKLLLFDIDGTILQTHGVGRRAVEKTVSELVGRNISTKEIRFSGKTDPQIIREVLTATGLSPADVDALMAPALDRYAELMHETLDPERVTVLPGVRGLIEELSEDPNLQLAVLTGNLEPMAHLKLSAAGLATYFPFGAFGSDHEVRDELPAIALKRAHAYTGRHFRGKDIVIIGDTEYDIRCGMSVGAFAIGVCTGNYRREDLALHGPDVILDDLNDYALFRSHLG